MINALPILYKRDTKGKLRSWVVEYEGAGIRTVAGLEDGKKVTSEWKMCNAKNVGRANATTDEEQAIAEAQALWDKRIEKEYFLNVADVDTYDKFKPMLANDYTKKPITEGWSQPKLDGIRCIVNKNGMWTRSGKAITSCPHIWESVKGMIEQNPHYVLDGELYNHDLKADFNKIISLVRKTKSTEEDLIEAAEKVEYHVYDMFDETTPDMKFSNRVKQAYWAKSDVVKIVPTHYCANQVELNEMYSQYVGDGYEGQMVRLDEKYEMKRSKSLLKRKEFITEEYDVIQVLEGQGNWSGYAKRFILRDKDGNEFGSGVRGNQAQLKELWEKRNTAKGMPNWATLRYFELTPDGVPRFPVVIDYGWGQRED